MTNKAIITRRDGAAFTDKAAAAGMLENSKLKTQGSHGNGLLVEADDKELAALEKAGYRVKLLPEPYTLHIGAYGFDVRKGEPKVPKELEVPEALAGTWPQHLVQLAGPPNEEWKQAIEAQGVRVVEKVSRYALYVEGAPADVKALEKLPFVVWTGALKPAYKLAAGTSQNPAPGKLAVLLSATLGGSEAAKVLHDVERKVERTGDGGHKGNDELLVVVAKDRSTAVALACDPAVRWVEPDLPMEAYGERETQIITESFDALPAPNTGVTSGYQAYIGNLGLSGAGTTVAICDTGVDANANNNTDGHADLRGRQAVFVDYSGGVVTTDTSGHGTHVAGIAVGNAASGQTEGPAPGNFLWGQGTAPAAQFITQNFILSSPQPAVATLLVDASANGGDVMNNSWGVDNSGGTGYASNSRVIDQAVRDPQSGAAGLEKMVVVCAAGNSGGRPASIGSPHESKNDIVVGNSLTSRPGAFPGDDVRGISPTSSRGLAIDGRILPTVVAPGTDVSSAHSRTSASTPIPGTGVPDPANPGQLMDQYSLKTGTSMAAPHVSGTAALIIEWWRVRAGTTPSAALVKSLLVNGSIDLVGGQNWRCLNRVSVDKSAWTLESGSVFRRDLYFTPTRIVENNVDLMQVASLAAITSAGQWFFDPATNRLFIRNAASTNPGNNNTAFINALDAQAVANIPNGDQGWGRVSLENMVVQAPASDRGPKLFSDQRHAFTADGQEHVMRIAPDNVARPLRITLAWTDAAAAAGANPALVNDLDLEVTEEATGNVFKGNVFTNGFSVTGGAFDTLNNVECVYIQNPSGVYTVRVIASSVPQSAHPEIATPWQDFALVVDNAVYADASPVAVVPVIDRSGSMVSSGYVDVARTASKQFIGLMGVSDEFGVVSFGSTAKVEHPAGAAPALVTITGDLDKSAGQTAVDNIAFGGSTAMGAGLEKGRDLLLPSALDKAMVLLSDGYDNRSPSAMSVAAALPSDMVVHTCAMGPASDQNLLNDIADATGGKYYFMPTIDDLFEIYNYIRGQVSGDSIVTNESAMASHSRVACTVEGCARRATFTVAWADPTLKYVADTASKSSHIAIRLRDPNGKLLHPHTSLVKRTVGEGFVVFHVEEPLAGRWFVEVSTAIARHTRYTVGGFVDSPLRMRLALASRSAFVGKPIGLYAKVLHGKDAVAGFRARAAVTRQASSLADLAKKHAKRVDLKSKLVKGFMDDGMPEQLAGLAALATESDRSVFEWDRDNLSLRDAGIVAGLEQLALEGRDPFGVLRDRNGLLKATVAAPRWAGSSNIAVTAFGWSPKCGTKFVRKDMVSVLARG